MNDLAITTCAENPCDICGRENNAEDILVAIQWTVTYISGKEITTQICRACITEIGNLIEYAENVNLMEPY